MCSVLFAARNITYMNKKNKQFNIKILNFKTGQNDKLRSKQSYQN